MGGAEITANLIALTLPIGRFPKSDYSEVLVPMKEYVIVIDILRGMSLNLEGGKYQFAGRALKILPVTVGYLRIQLNYLNLLKLWR